jgi:hypothetical protein
VKIFLNRCPSFFDAGRAQQFVGCRVYSNAKLSVWDGIFVFAKLLQHLADKACPTGLMVCAESASPIPVKVFEKQQMIAPVRVCLKFLGVTEHRTPAIIVL